MDENILDILGLQLVEYFLNFQNYKPFKIPEKMLEHEKGKVYLIDPTKSPYQIIKVVKQEIYNHSDIEKKDEVIEIIKNQKLSNIETVKTLLIVINNDNRNETRNSPTLDLVIATPGKVLHELAKTFPDINQRIKHKFIDKEEDNNNQDDNEQLSVRERKWRKINFQNRRFLKDALVKSTNPHLVSTWFIFVLPIIGYIVMNILLSTTFSNKIGDLNDDLVTLIFGASYHNLVYGANQYWRWLVYPLVTTSSLNLVVSLWLFYLIGRYVEGFYGTWKAIIIWIGATILTGFVQSSIDQVGILSGFLPLTAISLGAMVPIIYNYKLFKSKLAGRITFIVVILFCAWMALDFPIADITNFLIGFGIGWLMGAIVSYHNRKLTLFYAFAPVALGFVGLMSILLVVLNIYYPYDNNNYKAIVLAFYHSYGL